MDTMEPYKLETKRTYDKYAEEYAGRKQSYTEKYLLSGIALFAARLPGKRVLDLGSGPGRDAVYLKKQGLQPVCVDISPTQVKLCKEKGLEAHEMDFEHLTFPDESFDGVWAYTSLLHLPKTKLDAVLEKICCLLRTGGIFFIGMKEGTFEGWQQDKHYPEHKRYVAQYTEEELVGKLEKYFTILHRSKVEVDATHRYVNVLCRVKRA